MATPHSCCLLVLSMLSLQAALRLPVSVTHGPQRGDVHAGGEVAGEPEADADAGHLHPVGRGQGLDLQAQGHHQAAPGDHCGQRG